jgi:sugar phosphate permease
VPLTLTATSDEPEEDQGLASGVFNTSQQVGGAVGLAVLAAIAAAVTASAHSGSRATALVSGYTTAFAVAAGITLSAVIIVVALLPVRGAPARTGALDLVGGPEPLLQGTGAGEPAEPERQGAG